MKFKFLLMSIIVIVGGMQSTWAAQPRVYIESNANTVIPGNDITIRILIDTETPINALELKLAYPVDLLQAKSLNDGQSIVSLWQTRDWQSKKGEIIITGGMPRAFAGTKGEIAKFTFNTIKEGLPSISIPSGVVYYADGKGTRIEATTAKFSFSIKKTNQSSVATSSNGTALPIQDQDTKKPVFGVTDTLTNAADSTRLAIFEVKDDDSGINDTQLRTMKWFTWSEWGVVSNPAKLPSGIWKYQIKARDNAGNESVHVAYIKPQIIKIIGVVILMLAFLMIARYFIIKK